MRPPGWRPGSTIRGDENEKATKLQADNGIKVVTLNDQDAAHI